jgi:hypothetical protein
MMKSAPAVALLGIAILLAPFAAAHAEFRIRTLHRSGVSYYCVWQEAGKTGSCQFASAAKAGSACECVGGKSVHHGTVSKSR